MLNILMLYNQSPELFHLAKLKLHSLIPLSPWATIILLPVSMNLTALDTSCKWNHKMLVLLWLAYFTYSVFKIHLCCSMSKKIIFCLLCAACGILVPQLGIEPEAYSSESIESWLLNCRGIPRISFFMAENIPLYV